MGSRFGFMLFKSGNDVAFIDNWQEHIDKINQEGLLVEEEGRKNHYRIPAYRPEQVTGTFDLIILFTKAMQLDDMLTQIDSLLTKDTMILCLANGLGNIETIQKHSSKSQIYVGVTLWSSELEGPGHIRATGSGSLEFQSITDAPAEMTNNLQKILNAAGLNAEKSENVLHSIWKKAAFNCVLNTYCAIFDCTVGEFGSSDQAMILAHRVVDEFVTVAKAKKIDLTADEVLTTVEHVFDPTQSGNHYPSMHQDLAKNRKTEIDYLNGAIVSFGQKLGLKTPYNDLLTHMIHEIEDIKGIK